MIGRVVGSILVVLLAYAGSTWLYLYGQTLKAEVAVAQIVDDAVVSATSRWVSGAVPSYLALGAALLLLYFIWRNQFSSGN